MREPQSPVVEAVTLGLAGKIGESFIGGAPAGLANAKRD